MGAFIWRIITFLLSGNNRRGADMKYIKLSKNRKTLVDDDIFHLWGHLKWHTSRDGYVQHTDNKNGRVISLHRLIMGYPEKLLVDHKNHNLLDNRRQNLRICSIAENNRNTNKKKITSSKFKGLSYEPNASKINPWRVSINFNGKSLSVGRFPNERWAAMAYDIAAKDL